MATVSDEIVHPRRRFRTGLRIQFRVIGALMMRELHTRYGRENIGYLWLILEPMLLATMVGAIHARGLRFATNGIDPVPLSLVGYCNFQTFRTIFNRAEGSIESNIHLLYHRQISVLDILTARALLEAAGTWVAFAILIGFATAVGLTDPPARPLYLIAGMLLLLWLSFGCSMVICGLTHDRRALGRLVHPVSYILMPLSGAFFILNALPPQARDVLLWIPLPHIFEILRYGWFQAAVITYVDWFYLAKWVFISTLIGLLLISAVRKRIHMP